jgi:SAM-dependent methyltransferase
MRNRGWDVQGIEASEEAENPHGITIHRSPFPSDLPLESGTFDVVTAWAVFEHLHDPGGAFSEARRLLRPGGQLIIQVPNLKSIYGRYSRQEDVPRHLYFFDEKTLARYGSQHGLRLLQVNHTTDLFGGSGRGILRLALVHGIGRSTDDFFSVWRATRRERFHRWPLLTMAWVAVSAVERVLLADWLVRRLRMSGQIVAVFER